MSDKPGKTRRKTKTTRQPSTPQTPTGAALPPTRTRTRPVIIAIGIAIAVITALAVWMLVKQTAGTSTVWVTQSTVHAGQQLTADSLRPIEVRDPTAAGAISDPHQAVGGFARVDLPAGSLLTAENTSQAPEIPTDKALVGVTVTAAQVPATTILTGQTVQIVDTPVTQAEPPAGTPSSITATVYSSHSNDDGGVTLDLIVPKDQGALLSAHAATGRIAVVVVPGEK